MGKIVSSISADNVLKVSDALLEYGKKACEKIKSYGGLPIYAGGDDLLFIAPVNGKNNNIFGLIDEIDKLYADAGLRKEMGENGYRFYCNHLTTEKVFSEMIKQMTE